LRGLLFEQLLEVMGQAQELGLHGFGRRGRSPRAGLAQFVFEHIEDFFQISALQIEEGDQARGQGELVGEKLERLAVGGVDMTDAPGQDVLIGGDQFILENAVEEFG